MDKIAITNAVVINEGSRYKGTILIENEFISKIIPDNLHKALNISDYKIIDAQGLLLLPGIIDDQVHFRDPGLTHKGDIYSESKAAAAGGVTSFMEMPNTIPPATTLTLLDEKYNSASKKSLVNYSFYLGATNNNIEEIVKIDPKEVCGVKVFMGSSTGNMLVDNREALDKIFKYSPTIITTHCEDETTIRNNLEKYRKEFGEDINFKYHAEIRSEEACYISSSLAVELAKKHNSRLHILHLSTQKELSLLDNTIPLEQKRITGEVCVHHLWFNNDDYEKLGWRIKWNPSVKKESDRIGLINGLKNNLLDVVATDHAPHLISEKNAPYFKSASGGPMVQHSLSSMLELSKKGYFPIELVVNKMCHAPATLFKIDRRGFIREGYYADLVLVNPTDSFEVTKESLYYKCGWSPLEGEILQNKVIMTMVNGRIVYNNGVFDESVKGKSLRFNQ